MTLMLKILTGVFGLYALILLGLYFGQRSLMYVPDRARIDPASIGLRAVVERVLTAPDGTRLITWQAKANDGQPTILYFHGNGGNLSYRTDRIKAFQDLGWGVLMLSYRGYGGSEGHPSEAANVADGELAYQTLLADGVEEGRVVVYGESLGTGVGTQIAAQHKPAGLILDAPFTSMADAAAYHYPWVWVRPFIKDRYDTASHITRVSAPILILHGALDPVVPVSMGRQLAKIAAPNVQLEIFETGDHVDLYEHGALAIIETFINEHAK